MILYFDLIHHNAGVMVYKTGSRNEIVKDRNIIGKGRDAKILRNLSAGSDAS